MILDQNREVTTNLTGGVAFTVSDDSAKIFSFLSNVLYKNKERSVLTELCSNALDAHRMVGKEDVPIQVVLPTQLSAELRIRDFGPGLSNDNVIKFLTKYGESSKNGSNNDIGGFGIGAKSPAAVTNTWTINSHFDGNVTSFLIHVSANGIPSINQLFSKPTDETGVEVIVPVSNHRQWAQEASHVFEHYSVMPVVKGTTAAIVQKKFESEFKNLVKFGTNDRYSNTITILMNHREYSVDRNKINSRAKNLFTGYATFPFSTSSLSVSLSREDLQFDDRTIAAINSRIDVVFDELKTLWNATVETQTSIIKYSFAVQEFKNKYRITDDVCRKFAHGSVIGKSVNFSSLSDFNFGRLNMLTPPSASSVEGSKMISLNGRRGSFATIDYTYTQGQSVSPRTHFLNVTIKHDKPVTFVLKDHTLAASRVKHAIAIGKISSRALILDQAWFDVIPDELIKIKASSLDKAPAKPRAASERIESEIFAINGRRFVKTKFVAGTDPVVCLTFSAANSVENIIDEFDKKCLAQGALMAADVIAVKFGTPIPSYAITAKQFVESQYNHLMQSKKMIDDSFLAQETNLIRFVTRLAEKCPTAKVLNFISSEMTRVKHLNTLTMVDLRDKIETCGRLLGKPYVYPQSLMLQLYDAYPMLKIVDKYVRDDDSVCIITDYVSSIGK